MFFQACPGVTSPKVSHLSIWDSQLMIHFLTQVSSSGRSANPFIGQLRMQELRNGR